MRFIVKKLFLPVVVLSLFLLPFASSCSDKPDPADILTEVKFNVYEGVGEKVALLSDLSFGEFPKNNDMKKGIITYIATFRLLPKDNLLDKNYSISFELGGLTYGDDFEIDEISGYLVCAIPFDKKTEYDSLTVTIKTTDCAERITLKSLLPENTVSYKTALAKATVVLKDLFGQNTVDGKITGELRMRVIVKKGKAFWYVGYHYSETDCVALLLDGETGELLARRNKR